MTVTVDPSKSGQEGLAQGCLVPVDLLASAISVNYLSVFLVAEDQTGQASHSRSTYWEGTHLCSLVWLQLSQSPLIRDLRELALKQALHT